MKSVYQLEAKVIKNIAVREKYYKILLYCPGIARQAQAGQFVMIKVGAQQEPLLRRPFSVHKVTSHPSAPLRAGKSQATSKIEILYEVVGEGSRLLAQKRPGELLDVIGPLGKGFDLRGTRDEGRGTMLVAGGMGVAPLLFLAEKLTENRTTPACRQAGKTEHRTLVLIGAKTKSHILCEKEFKSLGYAVKIATDDGSRGFKGRVTDLLKCILRAPSTEHRAPIYACGPTPMLKAVAALSKQYNIPAQVSLEAHMACGIGACLGCVVKTEHRAPSTEHRTARTENPFEYKRVCKDGPVFQADEIIWE